MTFMPEPVTPTTNVIGYAAYITDGTDWQIILNGDRPFASIEEAVATLAVAAEEAQPSDVSTPASGIKTFITPLTVPTVEPVSEEQRNHLHQAIWDAVSPNWEIDSDGYRSAVDAVIAADWRPPVVVTA
jgi:hypothetical protein